jgi:hypothetical protein
MKDSTDKKTSDLLAFPQRGRPTIYMTEEEAKEAHRQQKAEYARRKRGEQKRLDENEALKANHILQGLFLDDVKKLTDDELRKLNAILHHWEMLTASEMEARRGTAG